MTRKRENSSKMARKKNSKTSVTEEEEEYSVERVVGKKVEKGKVSCFFEIVTIHHLLLCLQKMQFNILLCFNFEHLIQTICVVFNNSLQLIFCHFLTFSGYVSDQMGRIS